MAYTPRIQQFDTAQMFAIRDAARERGLDDERRSNLQRIGQMASRGDISGAANEAFSSGNLDIGASLRGMAQDDQVRLVEEAASFALAADTPDKWEAARPQWAQRGFDIGGFEGRQALINRALGVKGVMAQQNADRAFGFQQEQAAIDNRRADAGLAMQRERLNMAQAAMQQQAAAAQGGDGMSDEYRKTRDREQAKADVEAAQAAPKVAGAARTAMQKADLVVQEIDRIMRLMDSGVVPETGVPGAVAGQVPGTDAYKVRGLLDTIRANIGFDELQTMRDNSPTGGALGQVTERELALLQALQGNLDPGLGAEFVQNLQRLRSIMEDRKRGIGAALEQDFGGGQRQPAPQQGGQMRTPGGLMLEFE